jgi:hypothetical protein
MGKDLAYDANATMQCATIQYDKQAIFLGQLRLVPKIGQGVN